MNSSFTAPRGGPWGIRRDDRSSWRVTFPGPGPWDVPATLWHWDNPAEPHLDRLRGLFVVSFIGPVAPGGGGTLILSGSHRLLIEQERQLPDGQRRGSVAALRERFHRSHPWLMALTGTGPSPADRVAAFMERETVVGGVPLRVAELTGEPGDMVFCHPVIVLINAYYERPAILDLAGDVAGRRVLDAGCGSGPLFAALRDQGAVVTGFDSSATMLELARRRLGDGADLHLADLGRPLPFGDGGGPGR